MIIIICVCRQVPRTCVRKEGEKRERKEEAKERRGVKRGRKRY
jgi:hypothetical protein